MPIENKEPLVSWGLVDSSKRGGGRVMTSLEHGVEEAAVQVLGGFELWVGGRLVPVPTSSERVLAFVALHGRQAARGLVAGTLWPDSPEEKARGSLRSALWRLQIAAEGVIKATTGSLRLADGVRVDIDECRALASCVSDAALNSTSRSFLQMLSAELLPGWYEDWVMLEAERWRQVRLQELELLARRFLDEGRYPDAVLIALEARDAEPLRESACALLIEAHLRQGNRSEALRQYDSYRKVLAEGLGREPTLRLHNLVESCGEAALRSVSA
jgi:SARP family transcriptional regulator, regulator of embCAB operon